MVDNEMFATLNQDLVIKGKFYDKENKIELPIRSKIVFSR